MDGVWWASWEGGPWFPFVWPSTSATITVWVFNQK